MTDERQGKRDIYRDLEKRTEEAEEKVKREEKGAFGTKVEEISESIQNAAGDGGSLATYMGVGAGLGYLGDLFLPVRSIPIIGPASTKVMTIGGALFGAGVYLKNKDKVQARRKQAKALAEEQAENDENNRSQYK